MIKILSVNYNTPEHVEKLIISYFKHGYDQYPLIIIDGSDNKKSKEKSVLLQKKYKVAFDFLGYNIHHGPGLHYGMNKFKADYFLLVDSDLSFLKKGFVEYCLENTKPYGIGRFETCRAYNDIIYPYMHPNGCLIKYSEYLKYKPLYANGAPFRNTMVQLHELGVFNDMIAEIDTPTYYSFVDKGYRGTREKSGMSAHTFGRLNKKFKLI